METLSLPGEDDGSTTYFIHCTTLVCRTLLSPELGDEPGELTVGGQATGNFYTGTLQDVRIYQGILQLR